MIVALWKLVSPEVAVPSQLEKWILGGRFAGPRLDCTSSPTLSVQRTVGLPAQRHFLYISMQYRGRPDLEQQDPTGLVVARR